jgi:ribonuclease Z
MEIFEIRLLGCNAALPAFGRFPSSQIINIHEQLFLIDCGEGTQFQLIKYNIRRSRIQHIFISHLHGDHIYGLPGLITSFSLMDRQDPLYIYGPVGIKEMISHYLSYSSNNLRFELHFHEVVDYQGKTVYEDDRVKVKSLPLNHTIPTCGYLFEEKIRKHKLNLIRIQEESIPVHLWKQFESGKNIDHDGRQHAYKDFIVEERRLRKYAYCSDTRYEEKLIPFLNGVDLLYHETTYLDELRDKANDNGHATAKQAAMIAAKSNAKQLLTGHYSSRYENLEPIREECQSYFHNVILGIEGLVVKI